MEPEDFDMKSRKVSEEGFPAFDNEAWDKMEFLLDKHLPQKKEKKTFFFWWFTALVPVALITGYYLSNWSVNNTKPAKPTTAINEITDNSTSTPQTGKNHRRQQINQSKSDVSKANLTGTNEETTEISRVILHDENNAKISFPKSAGNIRTNKGIESTAGRNNIKPSFNNGIKNNGTVSSPQSNISSAAKEKKMDTDNKSKAQPSLNQLLADKKNDKPTSNQTTSALDNKEINKPSPAADTSSSIKQDNAVKNKTAKSNFYLTITSGLEANGTRLANAGTLTPVYGAGVQYSQGKVFLRTGILVTKKIYAAKDKDYNRKTGTWMSAVTFDNIDADCKVIEVPLAIGYKLSNNRKTGVYVTTGTSAYFMKKEDYQFYFKGQSGNDTTRHSTFTNNSNHYFSSINLSAGIEQKLTNRLSITAEPTIKLPVGGIGFGKVKVYSAGLLITAKLRLK